MDTSDAGARVAAGYSGRAMSREVLTVQRPSVLYPFSHRFEVDAEKTEEKRDPAAAADRRGMRQSDRETGMSMVRNPVTRSCLRNARHEFCSWTVLNWLTVVDMLSGCSILNNGVSPSQPPRLHRLKSKTKIAPSKSGNRNASAYPQCVTVG